MQLGDLETDVLLAILQRLDALSLAAVCCACRRLSHVAASAELWQPLAERRWAHIHAPVFPAQAGATSCAASTPCALAGETAPLVADGPASSHSQLQCEKVEDLAATEVSASTRSKSPHTDTGSSGPATGSSPTATGTVRDDRAACLSPSKPTATDWRALYAGGNGWRRPRMDRRRLPLAARDCEFISALTVSPAGQCSLPEHSAAEGDVVLLASSHNLEAWDAGLLR